MRFRFVQRNRWSRPPSATFDILRNATLGANHRFVTDLDMSDDADLSAYHDLCADPNAAGDPGLRRDHRVLSDDDVVGHLHQIVDLHAVLNPGPSKTGAVDRGIGADFDVVINLHNSNLRDLFIFPFPWFEPETIRADHDTAMNDDAGTDLRAFANRDVRINQTVRAYDRFMADVTSRSDNCIVPDRYTGLDDGMRLNGNAFTEFDIRGDDRAAVNSGREGNGFRCEFENDLLEGFRRIGNANLRRKNLFRKIVWNKSGGGACLSQQWQIAAVAEKRYFPRTGFGERSSSGNGGGWIAEQLAAAHGREFLKGKRHNGTGADSPNE